MVDTFRNISFMFFSPCTGESMILTGTAHFVVGTSDGGIHTTDTLSGLQAIGLMSGLKYVGSQEVQLIDHVGPPGSDEFENSVYTKVVRVQEDPTLFSPVVVGGDDLYIRFHEHITISASGVPAAEFAISELRCQ